MTKKRLVWAALAVLVVGSVCAWRWIRDKDEGPRFEPVRVELGDIEVTILATGMVQPQNRVEIKPPISGRAEKILAKEGQKVKQGQLLAWMSSTERAALLDAARAKGPEELAHWQDLYKPAPLVAPLDGEIIARKVEPGQAVTAQDAVFIMSDRLIIKAQVDETDIGSVRVGQRATITLDAYPDESVSGKVDHIAFEATTVSNVTVYEVDILPERVPSFMRSGMTANVQFLIAAKNGVLVLPAQAVHSRGERSMVLIRDPEGGKRPSRMRIETGLSDGKRVEVVSGLREDDEVLLRTMEMPKSRESAGSNPFMPFGRGRGGGGRGGGGGGSGGRGGGGGGSGGGGGDRGGGGGGSGGH
ncbi:MAG: HlyD family efflux transporter periplasmic adaptor subunit [Elusimicrobiota bacterium]